MSDEVEKVVVREVEDEWVEEEKCTETRKVVAQWVL
jgi:hypothetical protein